MKKILLVICFLLLLVACDGNKKSPSNNKDSNEVDVFYNYTNAKVDYDLSAMNSTMVYSQVYNMLNNPSEYYDKTFRVSGTYANSYYEKTDQYYHYIVINDALACCNQGIEFVWKGNHSLSDYPTNGEEIIIRGKFSYYYELGVKYDCLIIE